ncbi:MAG: erythromycin esterase family protein, partial [Chloroflexi bacterium]|nr:erythromycin esterase family protein [Chloroflexota bacterium]
MSGNTPGFRRIPLLFSLLLIALVACAQSSPSTKTPMLSSDPVVRWIQQHAIPLRTPTPGGSDADLAPLKQIVGSASIVGLGEETHGTHEFIEIKARLVEFLISNMGFTTLVMENDWGSSKLLDVYINGGPGNLQMIMTKALFGAWQTQEYEQLFAWLRAYNANPAHTVKIHFLGMDLQVFDRNDFDTVENYVQTVDPKLSTLVGNLYKPLIANGVGSTSAYRQLAASTKQQYQVQAQQVYDLLQSNQQRYSNASSPQQFALALQNARIIVETATYLNATTSAEALAHYYQRDTFMAENVEWIDEHDAGAHPKIMVWAHDGHIANDTTYGTQDGRNLGGELRAHYHQSYLPIGTTLYQGTYRTYTFYPSNKVQTISPPSSNTYNYTLGQAGLPLYMLDLRTIPSGAVSNWAQGSSIFLVYGLGGQDLSTPAQLS